MSPVCLDLLRRRAAVGVGTTSSVDVGAVQRGCPQDPEQVISAAAGNRP